jgi:hypothetical protein
VKTLRTAIAGLIACSVLVACDGGAPPPPESNGKVEIKKRVKEPDVSPGGRERQPG